MPFLNKIMEPKPTKIGTLLAILHELYGTTKNVTQIEKEALSIVFGVKHFHEYLYGRRFIIINDHKPLKVIFNRSIFSCPYRIQIIFLRLQKYDF